MQIKLFTIPAFDNEGTSEELNKFLRSHRVLEVQQEFVSAQPGAYWSCCWLEYKEWTPSQPNQETNTLFGRKV